MKDVLIEIRTELYQNAALLTLLEGKRVYKLTAPNGEEFPRIVMNEVTGVEGDFADDAPTACEYFVQLSVFSRGDTIAIAKEVHKTMKENGWTRYFFNESLEDDTKVYHRVLRYKNKFVEGE